MVASIGCTLLLQSVEVLCGGRCTLRIRATRTNQGPRGKWGGVQHQPQAGGRERQAKGVLLVVSSTPLAPLKGQTPVSRSRYLIVEKGFELSILQASTAASMFTQSTGSLKGRRARGVIVFTLCICSPEGALPSSQAMLLRALPHHPASGGAEEGATR